MKRIALISLLFLVWQCSRNPNQIGPGPVYIYDSANAMKCDMNGNTIFYSMSIPVYTSWGDSITFEISRKGYFFLHFCSDENGLKRDTSFNKPITFLESIDYYDSDWLKKEENLDHFWNDVFYKSGGRDDMLEIYLIHQIPGTDSIHMERVHRFFMPNREG